MIEGDAGVRKLKERFPGAVLDVRDFRGETTVVVRAADVLPVCQFLSDDPDLAYDLCIFVSAMDQLDLGRAASHRLDPRLDRLDRLDRRSGGSGRGFKVRHCGHDHPGRGDCRAVMPG